MFHTFLPGWLAALALLLSSAAQAQAQPQAEGQASPPYSSAFEGYQPFTDSKLKPWKESNDAVLQAGGWRAYAKGAAAPASQAATPPTATTPPAPPTAPSSAKPAAADPHAGHGKY